MDLILFENKLFEIPIQWNYYHISNESGRQLALVFTFDARMAERFAAADRTIVSTFEFLDSQESASLETARKTGTHKTDTRSR